MDDDISCKIIVVGLKTGDDALSELYLLPPNAVVVGHGSTLEELESDGADLLFANVILCANGTAASMKPIVAKMPNLVWIHCIFAGLDHLLFPELISNERIVITNAKGLFSSSLAEYVMGACAYFSKDFPRLIRQKNDHTWEKYCVKELRGQSMGIIGYGDIGRACAELAKAYGMRILALRRRPELSKDDPLVDEVYSTQQINEVMSLSDYLVVVAPLTPETRGMIGREQFAYAKTGQIFINIGRGALIDEMALIEALQEGGQLAGAALDVFCKEPLPDDSPIWTLPNLLLSPHNADMTVDFRHRSVRVFTDNCRLFLAKKDLISVVDKRLGY